MVDWKDLRLGYNKSDNYLQYNKSDNYLHCRKLVMWLWRDTGDGMNFGSKESPVINNPVWKPFLMVSLCCRLCRREEGGLESKKRPVETGLPQGGESKGRKGLSRWSPVLGLVWEMCAGLDLGLSAWSLHALLIFVCLLFRYFSFLPLSKIDVC